MKLKLAIINDTHFGARNDSQLFLDQSFKFFEEQFFPYCKENNITTVLHLGDFLDRRKFVNFNTLSQVRTRFIDKINEYGIQVHCILGNHDTYYRNTNRINSIRELFSDTDNFHLYEDPVELEFGGLCIGMVPWINKNNTEQCIDFIKNSTCPIMAGHFELDGYEVMRGVKYDGGLNDKLFSRCEMVLSGHFHSKYSKNNVHYLGTQYQLTFSDLNVKKGFHVLDTETRDLRFVENPVNVFHAITYEEDEDMLERDYSKYENSYVKVYVFEKNNPYLFDKFLDKLYDVKVANLTVIEDMGVDDTEEDSLDISKDTVSIINDEVDTMTNVPDDQKSRIKSLMRELYMESLSL